MHSRLRSTTQNASSISLYLSIACSTAAFALEVRAPTKLSRPEPKVALSPAIVPKFAEYKCVACHQDVAREWASDAHAIAWVDEEYIEQLADKKRPETCWGCHAPKPLLAGDLASKPVVREEDRHLGINCESCHVDADGKVRGPRGTKTAAHISEVSDVFVAGRSNALCVSCHRFNVGPVVGVAKDFESAKLADAGFSCVGCHLADVEMKFASATAGEDPPVRKGKSHAFQTPRDPLFLAGAFDITFETKEGKSSVRVANRAGHRVPGLVGRELEFEAIALDATGAEIGRKTLKIDATAYLPIQGELTLALGVGAASVHLVGKHTDPRAVAPIIFIDTTLVAQK